MTPRWHPLPDGLGHVRLEGPRPALRTAEGAFLRLHRLPAEGGSARRAYLRTVADFARTRADTHRREAWPEGRRRVSVLGNDRLATHLAAELARQGADVRRLRRPPARPAADRIALEADLLVAVTARPPSRAVADLLARLPAHGTAVLHGHADGASFLLMPLATDALSATAEQVHRRRLAASPAAEELAHWRSAAPQVPLAPTLRALVVARTVALARSWSAGAPETDTLTILHPDLRETRHVVLGYDEPAPREVIP